MRKRHEQKGFKPATKQTNAGMRIAALKAKLGASSQLKEGDDKKAEGETPKDAWGRNRGNPAVTHQELCSK